MADSKIEVKVVGDTKDFDRAMDRAEKKTGKFGGALGGLAKGAALGGAIGGVALLGKGLFSSVGAAQEAQKAQARMEAQLKALHIPLSEHADVIDEAISKTSKLAAVDDEELQASFTKLLPATGDVNKALEGMALAADIAAARNISLESATQLVTKANTGSAGALRKIGISLIATHENLDKAREASTAYAKAHDGQVSPAMKRHFKDLEEQAKGLDKSAQATKNLETLQKTFAGAAESYGDTAAGAQAKLGVAFENLQETVGAKLLPVLTTLSLRLVDLIGWIESNWPRFKQIVNDTWTAMKPSFDAIIAIVGVVKDTIEKHSGTIQRNFDALKTVVVDALKIVRTAIELVNDLLHGKWGEAWADAKEIVRLAIDAVKTILTNQLDNVKALALAMGAAVLNGIKGGLTGVGEFVLGVLTGLKEMLVNQVDNVKTSATNLGKAVLNGIKDGATGIGEWALGVLSGIKTAITNAVDNVKTAATSFGSAILDGIVAGIKGVGAELLKWITTPINAVIAKVNTVFSSINSALEFSSPGVKVLGKTVVPSIGFDAPDIPSIPHLAGGGIVRARRGGTLALLGEGGRDEAVVPLGRRGTGGNTYITVHVPGLIGTKDELARRLVQILQLYANDTTGQAFQTR